MPVQQRSFFTKSRLIGLLVVLSLTLPFLDVSRVVLVHERDEIKTVEKQGPFYITADNGEVIEVPKRPELFNVTGPLHVIKSRFMQHQPGLKALGWARYKLFKYLCFPSMVAQTSQNFVWLIYTDPDIKIPLREAIEEMLRPYPHFYLITDNTEARFRGGTDLEKLDWEDVIMGDVQRLRYMLQQRDRFPFLETRIDADDGLHTHFVEQIQKEALKTLNPQTTHWTYWCIKQALEWHWVGSCGVSKDQKKFGALLPSRLYENYCHTPGMTLGLYRADENVNVLSVAHSRLWSTLETEQSHCGPRTTGTDCIIHVDDFRFAALRARTPTSASMVGVNKQPIEFLEEWDAQKEKTWSFAKRHFGINKYGCQKTLQYLEKHLPKILEDAEVGQCTEGHSCRKKAAQMIKNLLEGNQTCVSAAPAL